MGLLFVDNEPKYRYLHKSDSVSIKRGLRFRNSQLLKDEERLQYLLELATLRRRGQASNSPYIRHIIRCFLLRIALGYPDYNTARTAIMEVEEQESPLTAQAIHELFVDVLQNGIKATFPLSFKSQELKMIRDRGDDLNSGRCATVPTGTATIVPLSPPLTQRTSSDANQSRIRSIEPLSPSPKQRIGDDNQPRIQETSHENDNEDIPIAKGEIRVSQPDSRRPVLRPTARIAVLDPPGIGSADENSSRTHTMTPISLSPLQRQRSPMQRTRDANQPRIINDNHNDDIPSLKRHFDQVQEETDRLEKEYNKLVMEWEATKKARLLKKIKEGEQKNSEWKAKIERLKKVDSDEDIS